MRCAPEEEGRAIAKNKAGRDGPALF